MNATAKALRETKHFKTEVDPVKLGESKAEVCFVGRSNVGKSSLINAVCQKKSMAHASQIPGKTRTINIYEVTPGRWIVDLPGYGFAVGLKDAKDALGKTIEAYLFSRKNLAAVFIMIDAVAGPTKLDVMMIAWLKYHVFLYNIIVSKIDKIASPAFTRRQKEIAGTLAVDISEIFWISSRKGIGIVNLQDKIGKLLHI